MGWLRGIVALTLPGCMLGCVLGCGQGAPRASTSASTPASVGVLVAPVEKMAPGRYGWISEVALDPTAFSALMEKGREGWIALHANDYQRALDAFPEGETARARVEWQLFLLHTDLARYAGFAYERFFSEWDARTTLPPESAATVVATLASFCSETGSLAGWASRTKPKQLGFDLAQEISRGRAPWDIDGTDIFARRMALHRLVRTSGEYEPLLRAAMRPLVSEPVGDFERTFYDPCLHRTLADHWETRTAQTLGGTDWLSVETLSDRGLAGRLFSAWLTGPDLHSEFLVVDPSPGALGAHSPSLRALGVGTNPHPGDDRDAALSEIHALDVGLAKWRVEVANAADDNGRSILNDLKLFERFRQEWLSTRARYALVLDRPVQALAYIDAARDPTDRFVGSANSPIVWALLAEANLKLGRTREALDALHVLSGTHPEIVGLKELTGNLDVLRSLDAEGESKEE